MNMRISRETADIFKTSKELKMEEKARERRMQEEDRELLYGEKARRKKAKKEQRKKIHTGGFVDEIYEDDLEEDREPPSGRKDSGKTSAGRICRRQPARLMSF